MKIIACDIHRGFPNLHCKDCEFLNDDQAEAPPLRREDDQKEAVNHPSHYNQAFAKCENCGHPIECITVVENLGFNLGNCIKYLWRAPSKSKLLEDLKKAAWYLNREISKHEKPEKSGNP